MVHRPSLQYGVQEIEGVLHEDVSEDFNVAGICSQVDGTGSVEGAAYSTESKGDERAWGRIAVLECVHDPRALVPTAID